jgi:hypothetical protein
LLVGIEDGEQALLERRELARLERFRGLVVARARPFERALAGDVSSHM